MSKPLIIADTRDKKPWNFLEDELFLGTTRQKVEYGDYTIEGLEHLIFMERKANAKELAQNITEKRFHKLMEMAQEFKYKYIIVECPFEHLLEYPKYEQISAETKKKIKIHPNLLLSYFARVTIEYGINVLFCSSVKGGQAMAYRLLRQIYRREKDNIIKEINDTNL